MKRYLLYDLKPKSGKVIEHEELKAAQDAAKKMKHYVIFDSKEDRIIEISKG